MGNEGLINLKKKSEKIPKNPKNPEKSQKIPKNPKKSHIFPKNSPKIPNPVRHSQELFTPRRVRFVNFFKGTPRLKLLVINFYKSYEELGILALRDGSKLIGYPGRDH